MVGEKTGELKKLQLLNFKYQFFPPFSPLTKKLKDASNFEIRDSRGKGTLVEDSQEIRSKSIGWKSRCTVDRFKKYGFEKRAFKVFNAHPTSRTPMSLNVRNFVNVTSWRKSYCTDIFQGVYLEKM